MVLTQLLTIIPKNIFKIRKLAICGPVCLHCLKYLKIPNIQESAIITLAKLSTQQGPGTKEALHIQYLFNPHNFPLRHISWRLSDKLRVSLR